MQFVLALAGRENEPDGTQEEPKHVVVPTEMAEVLDYKVLRERNVFVTSWYDTKPRVPQVGKTVPKGEHGCQQPEELLRQAALLLGQASMAEVWFRTFGWRDDALRWRASYRAWLYNDTLPVADEVGETV